MEVSRTIEIPELGGTTSLWSGDEGADTVIILAHGAGNDMHSAFLQSLSDAFADSGLLCVRFNFLYKKQGRRAPDRAPVLEATWQAVIDRVRHHTPLSKRLVLAGKSMGGRIASMVVAKQQDHQIAGLVFLGYPLHPPGRPERMRHAHLPDVSCPMLFVQGTRDSLCDLGRLRPVLAKLDNTTLHEIAGGDHSFKVLKKLGRTAEQVLQEIVQTSVEWIRALK